ncbi:DMT family transporter [Marispirochaeta sp.]|jgi:drug/metabolite transporter (DMT)-like permease|uniref:DMT family transporter n=1 Tax=Marispirochaeta sp. TaxID=2038653 RepID=UPI0029C807FA|nr:DMT family transporter [Marispirochaeta sp.]
MIFLLSLTAALLFGIGDFSGGYASRRQAVGAVLFTSQLFGLLLVSFVSPLLLDGLPVTADLLWGAAAGIGGAVGILFLYHALAHTVVAIVSPTAALVGALLPLVFGLIIGDGVSLTGWIGIGLILPAVVLLSYEHLEAGTTLEERRRAFLFGIGAGTGFGLFFILIAQTDAAAGLWPLAGARFASLALVAFYSILGSRPLLVRRQGLIPTIMAGTFDMAANIAFMLAVQSGRIILVTAVTSVYPAPTVLLARFINGEKVHPLRWAGLAAAAAGVACMGIG